MVTCIFENGKTASLRHAVVQAVVIHDGKILLTQRAPGLIEAGKWGLPGGYVNRDETLKQAIEREIKEETGWTVTETKLLSIIDNPNRPNDDNRQNIAFNYVCKANEKVGEPDTEVTHQQWYPLTALPSPSNIAFDHMQVIEEYNKQRQL